VNQVRFSLRRKQSESNSSDSSEGQKTLSSLGIFSPSIESVKSDPQLELKRLAELEAIFIRSRRLESLDDVPFVVNQIRDGNIVLLDISRLNDGNEQTHLELKRIIERVRGETRSYGADIALVNDNCLIVTPNFVRI
jgi:SepF-like predicted cell division protein (DUF552 family)